MYTNTISSGNPTQNLPSTDFANYDYHNYVKWNTAVTPSRDSYMRYSCTSSLAVAGQTPLIVGEWSLSVPDNMQDSAEFSTTGSGAIQFFQYWFIAQQQMYERSAQGWIFWSWKTSLGDWRWDYSAAVAAGVIPKRLDRCVKWQVCKTYTKKREAVPEALSSTVLNGTSEAVAEPVVDVIERAPEPSANIVRSANHMSHHRKHRRHAHGGSLLS
jgi:hypothetical protein